MARALQSGAKIVVEPRPIN